MGAADEWSARLAAFHGNGRCGTNNLSPSAPQDGVDDSGSNGGCDEVIEAEDDPAGEVLSDDRNGGDGRVRSATCVETPYRQKTNVRYVMKLMDLDSAAYRLKIKSPYILRCK